MYVCGNQIAVMLKSEKGAVMLYESELEINVILSFECMKPHMQSGKRVSSSREGNETLISSGYRRLYCNKPGCAGVDWRFSRFTECCFLGCAP